MNGIFSLFILMFQCVVYLHSLLTMDLPHECQLAPVASDPVLESISLVGDEGKETAEKKGTCFMPTCKVCNWES
jgi:hypothetical protein